LGDKIIAFESKLQDGAEQESASSPHRDSNARGSATVGTAASASTSFVSAHTPSFTLSELAGKDDQKRAQDYIKLLQLEVLSDLVDGSRHSQFRSSSILSTASKFNPY
jgi:hypothetical protein